MVPQMARISSGSSSGSVGAEKVGAEGKFGADEEGRARRSEGRLSPTARRGLREGVILNVEWISPRRFLGVAAADGVLDVCQEIARRFH